MREIRKTKVQTIGYSRSMKTGTENRTGPGLVEPKTEPEPAFRTENRTGTDFFKFLGTGTRTGTEKKSQIVK